MTSCGRATVNAVPHADTCRRRSRISTPSAVSTEWCAGSIPVTLLPSSTGINSRSKVCVGFKDIKDHTTLKRTLSALYHAVAPTNDDLDASEHPRGTDPRRRKRRTSRCRRLANEGYATRCFLWEMYAGKRRHRPRVVSGAAQPVVTLSQSFDATSHREGLSGCALSASCESWTGADLARVDSKQRCQFFDNMFDRPVTAKSWKSVEISGSSICGLQDCHRYTSPGWRNYLVRQHRAISADTTRCMGTCRGPDGGSRAAHRSRAASGTSRPSSNPSLERLADRQSDSDRPADGAASLRVPA